MTKVLHVKTPCTILVGKNAKLRLGRLAQDFYADGIAPFECKCLRCGCEWNDVVLVDPEIITCSNCYSDRMVITIVRLTFENWGEQNGGEREQRERYEAAKLASIPPSEPPHIKVPKPQGKFNPNDKPRVAVGLDVEAIKRHLDGEKE